MKFGVGQSVGRLEDRRFITGSGCYTDDVDAGAGLRVVAAPHSHARLKSLDCRAAETAPGLGLWQVRPTLMLISRFIARLNENFDAAKCQ